MQSTDISALTGMEQALALGNPSNANQPQRPADIAYENLRMIVFTVYGDGNSGSTVFSYGVDEDRYDNGHIVIVSYSRNFAEECCVENETLDCESYLFPRIAHDHVVPIIRPDKTPHIVRATLETVEGTIKITLGDLRHTVFPQVSASLRIPCLPITSLHRNNALHPHIDLVSVKGVLYAFKHYGIDPEVNIDNLEDDPLLREVLHLCRFDSIYIVKPTFIVVGNDLVSFRGYLMPYFPAGSLTDVFKRLNARQSVAFKSTTDQFSPLEEFPTLYPYSAESDRGLDMGRSLSMKVLSWSVKEAWAFQIIKGVAFLHNISSLSGDIKLDNILLGQDGCVRLIDAAPTHGFTVEYLSPEQDIQNLTLTGQRDIFALGLVLWALSEEVPYFLEMSTSSSVSGSGSVGILARLGSVGMGILSGSTHRDPSQALR